MDQSPTDRVTLAIVATVSFAVLTWDHLQFLPSEFQVYQFIHKNNWRDPRPWLFILLRYTGFAALLTNLFMTSVPSESCQAVSILFLAFYTILMASFCALVTFRVAIFWKCHPDVVSALGLLGIAVIGAWIAVATQIRGFSQPEVSIGSNCRLKPFPPWFSATYAAALVFNLAAFSFAAADVLVKLPQSDRIMRRDTRLLAFLLICIGSSVAVLVISSLGYDQQVNKQGASGFYILIIATMGSRIYLTFGVADLETHLFRVFRPPSLRNSLPCPGWNHSLPSTNRHLNTVANPVVPKAPTTSPSVRAASVITSESTPLAGTSSLAPPQPHHYPSSSTTSAASSAYSHAQSQSMDTSHSGKGVDSQLKAPATSGVPRSPPMSVMSSVTSNSPVLFREPELKPSTSRGRKHQIASSVPGADFPPNRRALGHSSRSPGKQHRRLSDSKSGWVD